MKDSMKNFENFRKNKTVKKTVNEEKQLDDALVSAVAQAELIGAETGKLAKEKAKDIRVQKKEEALEKIKEQEEKIKVEKNKKIDFGEYEPRFRDSLAFKFIILFIVFGVIGAGIGLYFYFKNLNREIPTSLTLSATQVYYSDGDDFTLTGYLNPDYKGANRNLKISYSGGNGIIEIEETEVLSGKPFEVKVVKQNDVPVGGKVRVWVEDSVSGTQRAYCDIIIDTPITSINFVNNKSEIYVTESVDFNAVAKTNSTINDISTILGKKVSYRVFEYVENGGNFRAVKSGDDILYFEEVAPGLGAYNLISGANDIAEIENTILTLKTNAKIIVEASARKWLPQNETDNEVIYSVREINGKLIPIEEFELNNLYNNFTYSGSKLVYADMFDYSYNESAFNQDQVDYMERFFEVESSDENVEVIKYDDGFELDFSNTSQTQTQITISYDCGDGNGIVSVTITVKKP